ncbi:hypothetical protein [Treponema sp. UBA3813]|uniref:hypothetical protein n=1 Tax=Treponema sp. UBA3813 TaxID=1947715 RepID=UPI0025DFAE6B|nr:hypothetical protein [Treponema sp. UBA3813]
MKNIMNNRISVMILSLAIILQSCASTSNVSKTATKQNANNSNLLVQVVSPLLENIGGTEQIWLGGQIQDRLKSNLQDYLGMKIVADSKSEDALKKLQREAESEARNENTAIELGKITTARFALFSKIRKTNNGYIISADFTDLTTGEQKATATSKEYTKIEYLYGNTGAVDEITLALADKLGVKISDIYKKVLTNGTADFTVEAQLAFVEQNEANYRRLLSQLDEQLQILSVSTDKNADSEKRKIEAEKALLAEKQTAEAKRKIELEEEKRKSDADLKLEKERSIEFITQRDKLAQQAALKATEIRKMQIEQQGVFGQINTIENKKKVLVEIRQAAEQNCIELYEQYQKDRRAEIDRIKNKPYSAVELENGEPTKAAIQRRENQIIVSNDSFYNKFMSDAKSVKNATVAQENILLAEIRTDQKSLTKNRTVSSLDGELKVSYGSYSGENNGWNTYISLYSDGILLYEDTFILEYESLTGKKAPDVAGELNDSVINEYTNTVEMYNSLFARGTPLFHFELDYNVIAENDDKISRYTFNLNKIRMFSIVNEKLLQTTDLNKKTSRIMKPSYDISNSDGIIQKSQNLKKQIDMLRQKGFNDSQITDIFIEFCKTDDGTETLKSKGFNRSEMEKFINYGEITPEITGLYEYKSWKMSQKIAEEKQKQEYNRKHKFDKFMGGMTGAWVGGGMINGSMQKGGYGEFDFSYNLIGPLSIGADWRFSWGIETPLLDDSTRIDLDAYLSLGAMLPITRKTSIIVYTAAAPGFFVYQIPKNPYYSDKRKTETDTYIDFRAGLVFPTSFGDLKFVYSKEFSNKNEQMNIFAFLWGGRL